MKNITTEEAVILLKDFKDGKIEKDKLENYAKGGFKLGYFYTKDIQQAIEKVLNELEKKDKIIDAMLEEITDCEFEMQCPNCNYECEKDYDQLYECNKQYFERKIENE